MPPPAYAGGPRARDKLARAARLGVDRAQAGRDKGVLHGYGAAAAAERLCDDPLCKAARGTPLEGDRTPCRRGAKVVLVCRELRADGAQGGHQPASLLGARIQAVGNGD